MGPMKPEKNTSATYLLAIGVAGQIGCILTLSIGGAVVLGLLLDRLLGTKTLFIFLLLLASIPLNLWAIYRFTLYQSKRLQASSQKEDKVSDD
jgi:F0F1-type ATP synthase assembly protein I